MQNVRQAPLSGFSSYGIQQKRSDGKPSDLFVYPLRDSTALLKAGSRVLDFYIPPKSPFDKGGLCLGSRPMAYNKKGPMENHRTFSCTPSGTRTLDLSIKSALLYQLS